MKKLLALAIMVVFIMAVSPCWAGIPHLINYQGMLTDDLGEPLDTPQNLTFRIFDDSTGGTQEWGETQYGIIVTDGLFSVNLGDSTAIDLPFDEDYWLEIEVGVYGPLSPRVRLTSVGYAYRAERADTASYAIVAVSAETDSDWTISGNNMYSAVSGNVGIGTTNPDAALEVVGAGIADHLKLTNIDGGSPGPALYLNALNRDWVIEGSNPAASAGDQKLVFRDYTAAKDRVVIDSTGNVGIGTITPDEKMTFYYDSYIGWEYSGANSSVLHKIGKSSSGVGPLEFITAHNPGLTGEIFSFKRSDVSEVVTILYSGNVGIGTTSPVSLLEVENHADSPDIRLDATTGGAAYLRFSQDDDQKGFIKMTGGGDLQIDTEASGQEAITILNSNANVGIGTISPAAKLEVYYDNTNSNLAAIAIDNGAGAPRQDVLDFKFDGVTEARFRKATTGDLYIGTQDNKGIKFKTNTANRMVITNTGDVGIGTISPEGALDVSSTNGAFIVPRMTTTQRNALTAVNGMIVYDTTLNQFHFYENGSWDTK